MKSNLLGIEILSHTLSISHTKIRCLCLVVDQSSLPGFLLVGVAKSLILDININMDLVKQSSPHKQCTLQYVKAFASDDTKLHRDQIVFWTSVFLFT